MENSANNKLDVNISELAGIGLERSLAGFGLGLLLADRFEKKNRRRVGRGLFPGSIAAGLPLGIKFLNKNKEVFKLWANPRKK